MTIKNLEGKKIQDIYPNLVIAKNGQNLGIAGIKGKVSTAEFDQIRSVNDKGESIYFVFQNPERIEDKKAIAALGKEGIAAYLEDACTWGRLEKGVITDIGTPPPLNQEYLICEVGRNFNTKKWEIGKPSLRAVEDGKIQNGKAVFSYENTETEGLTFVLTEAGKPWGGKVQQEDVLKIGNSVVNAAIRETFEELNLSREQQELVNKAKAIFVERPDDQLELNGNVIATKFVVFHLGKLHPSALANIVPSEAGAKEGIKGVTHLNMEGLKALQKCDGVLKATLLDQANFAMLQEAIRSSQDEEKANEEKPNEWELVEEGGGKESDQSDDVAAAGVLVEETGLD